MYATTLILKKSNEKKKIWTHGNKHLELKPASNIKDIFNAEYLEQCKIKFEPSKHKGALPNVQTAKDTCTPKPTASFNRDASNAQVTT
jgi:hypothetical protein